MGWKCDRGHQNAGCEMTMSARASATGQLPIKWWPPHIHEPIAPYDVRWVMGKVAGRFARRLLNATPGQELHPQCGMAQRHVYPLRNNSASAPDSPPACGYSLWCHVRRLNRFRGEPWRLLFLLALLLVPRNRERFCTVWATCGEIIYVPANTLPGDDRCVSCG